MPWSRGTLTLAHRHLPTPVVPASPPSPCTCGHRRWSRLRRRSPRRNALAPSPSSLDPAPSSSHRARSPRGTREVIFPASVVFASASLVVSIAREVLAARAKSFSQRPSSSHPPPSSFHRTRSHCGAREVIAQRPSSSHPPPSSFHRTRSHSAARNVVGSASLVARPSSVVTRATSVDRCCRFHRRPLAPDVILSTRNVVGGAHPLILSTRNVAGGAHPLIGRRAASSDLARRRRGRPRRFGEPRPSSLRASKSSLPAPPMPLDRAQRLRIRIPCLRIRIPCLRIRIPRRRTWRDVIASRATSLRAGVMSLDRARRRRPRTLRRSPPAVVPLSDPCPPTLMVAQVAGIWPNLATSRTRRRREQARGHAPAHVTCSDAT